ncbi:F-box domain-containing protein [Xylariales sp. AK1849]|nr:F-box domain-containing protein [Xylariales sp. AK1849]
MRPPAPSLDVIAAQGQAAPATAAMAAAGIEVPTVVMTEAEARDSRSSSSTNSPVPRDNDESDFYHVNNDSESSLGVVPNLQDMQVNDQECLPIAATLPSEILISIFSRLSTPQDMFKCMLVSKRWARNVVEMLWHRPTCTSWDKHTKICQTLGLEDPTPTFAYPEFIKRLNLAALAANVSDGSVMPLAVCTRVERLTLTNCKDLTDVGLIALVRNSQHLLALDISQDVKITEASIFAIAENCRRLQGLNVSSCKSISNESMVQLAENCKYIKRLKLNDCDQLNDNAILAFANNCPNILEIDLHSCRNIGNEPVTALLDRGQSLRELRLANCDLIDDTAFLTLPSNKLFEHLRILDLTCCARLTDRAVEKIIEVAPRLRNLVLAKCGNITDAAVYAISKLGKNLHYVHLGHCRHITDDAVKRLVRQCNRIRYIDLGCCQHLTDDSVTQLATLPKLKRIGLVKCSNITDQSMYALAKANQRTRSRRDASGNIVPDLHHGSSLERVHLSYCVNLSLPSIIRLLNSCPKLTHLSLTGVPAFLRDDLDSFCREAPPDFTEHQRQVFCVFSGNGVAGLKRYLNNKPEFAEFLEPSERSQRQAATNNGTLQIPDIPDGFEDIDVVEDDDMGDGSEIALDTGNDNAQNHNQITIPPPPPPPFFPNPGDDSWHEVPNPSATQAMANGPLPSYDDISGPRGIPNQSFLVEDQQPQQAGPSTAGENAFGGEMDGASTASFKAEPDEDGTMD